MRQGQRVAIISSDAYYKSLDGKDPTTYNFDEPAAIDFDFLHTHLRQLKRGDQIAVPNYDFVTHSRMAKTTPIGDVDVVIVEGILVLFHEALRCVARRAGPHRRNRAGKGRGDPAERPCSCPSRGVRRSAV